jgi:CheY-like chemotaxis protein
VALRLNDARQGQYRPRGANLTSDDSRLHEQSIPSVRIDERSRRIRYWTTVGTREIVSCALRNTEDDSTRTVLVADDEPAIRTLIRTVLERSGHRVLEASSAAEIFQALDTERPDVLLLDVHLGTDDGLAIGTGLAQERQYAALKIVFMSGTAERREIIRLSELWGVSILLKPFELDALLDAVG